MAGDVPLRDAAQALLDAIKNRLDEGNQYGSGAFDEGYSAALTDVIAHPAASQVRAALAAADTDRVKLADIPLDGLWEVMHEGEDGQPRWLRYSPKHHLASVATDSAVYVTARRWPGADRVD